MRIVYLLESAGHLWGGVKIALTGANLLVERGHDVVVLSKTEAPDWIRIDFEYRRVPDFTARHIPPADLVVGTDWSTVPFAVACGHGTPVHFIQGYEGCMERNRPVWPHIHETYRLPTAKIVISQHLVRTMQEEFGVAVRYVPNMIDHDTMFPATPPKPRGRPVRIGLVGPYQIDWKDIPTALQACDIAWKSGLDFELVRISNTAPAPEEEGLPYPVEWHVQVNPADMGGLYRSMDLFVAPSQGHEEGFYLPAVEAMACGVPCVLTDIPCFQDYGDEQYALFVPPKNPLEMAQALVVATSHDSVRDALRTAGLQTAAQYTAQAHADALEREFLGILAAATPATPATAPVSCETGSGELRQLSSKIAQALSAASDSFTSADDYGAALKHIQAAVDIQPDDPDLLQQLGYVRYLAGDDVGALAIYDDLVERGCDSWAVLANKALVQVSRKDYRGAIESFEQAIARGGESAELVNNLGVAWHREGSIEKASSCFANALELDPDYSEAEANLRDIEQARGRA